MITIAVCDDNKNDVEKICDLINNDIYFQNYDIIKYYSGEEILQNKEKFDILVLDMELGDIDGINVAKKLRSFDKDFILIFMTAYREKIKSAFEVNTFRYLVKPFDYKILSTAIKDAFEIYNNDSIVIVQNKDDYISVKISKIMYIESLGRKTCVRMVDNYITTSMTILEFMNLISNLGFYQTHKSYIVNYRYIETVQGDEIIMDNGEKVKLSRRKKTDFIKKYHCYIRDKLK